MKGRKEKVHIFTKPFVGKNVGYMYIKQLSPQMEVTSEQLFTEVEVNSEQLFPEVEVNILGFSPTPR